MKIKISKFWLGLLGLVLALSLPIAPAHAQATRTWVSGVGDDVNPCSRTAPCKTFAGAISKTAPAGEINVLDPGGFGGVTITKSITISSNGFEAGVLVQGTNGIVVAAGPSDAVVLEGLDIEGLGTGLDGIKVLTGAKVFVKNSKIHHFKNNGINMASTTSGARLLVTDSFIFQNGTLNSTPAERRHQHQRHRQRRRYRQYGRRLQPELRGAGERRQQRGRAERAPNSSRARVGSAWSMAARPPASARATTLPATPRARRASTFQ